MRRIEYYTVREGYFISTRFSKPSMRRDKGGRLTGMTFHTTPRELCMMPWLCYEIDLLVFPRVAAEAHWRYGADRMSEVFATCMNRMNMEMSLLHNVGGIIGIGDDADFPLQFSTDNAALCELIVKNLTRQQNAAD